MFINVTAKLLGTVGDSVVSVIFPTIPKFFAQKQRLHK